jgi:hypothetical protein
MATCPRSQSPPRRREALCAAATTDAPRRAGPAGEPVDEHRDGAGSRPSAHGGRRQSTGYQSARVWRFPCSRAGRCAPGEGSETAIGLCEYPARARSAASGLERVGARRPAAARRSTGGGTGWADFSFSRRAVAGFDRRARRVNQSFLPEGAVRCGSEPHHAIAESCSLWRQAQQPRASRRPVSPRRCRRRASEIVARRAQ